METFAAASLSELFKPVTASHKGENGKLTIIGGSSLFHGASLWSLKVASRIVDMVFYGSTKENNQLTERLKGDLYDFIAVPREKIDEYIKESSAVLLGPGLPREEGREEGEPQTKDLTKALLEKFPDKKWVIDAGSLTEMDKEWLTPLKGRAILTPHKGEFEKVFGIAPSEESVAEMAGKYDCIILLKGEEDIICSKEKCLKVLGGNEGMTKGGTGDVLAGLVAALACKNDLFLAACAASFINKKAGESIYKRVGPYFNASDLCDEIPKVMKELLYG